MPPVQHIQRHTSARTTHIVQIGRQRYVCGLFWQSLSRRHELAREGIELAKKLNFDLIVTLSPEAHHKALELTRTIAADVEYWPTPDPTAVEGTREQRLAAYREVRDQLSERIKARFGWHPGGNE